MSNRLRRVPIQAKVTIGDGKIGRDGQFFIVARTQQGAVVANPESYACVWQPGCSTPNQAKDIQLAHGLRLSRRIAEKMRHNSRIAPLPAGMASHLKNANPAP